MENYRAAFQAKAEAAGDAEIGLPNPLDQIRPEAHGAAEEWLAEMLERVTQGIPPVTEVEFLEVGEWLHEQEPWIRRNLVNGGLIDLGNGRTTDTVNIRYGLTRGPRVRGAGQLADDVRRLKALLESVRRLPVFAAKGPMLSGVFQASSHPIW